jgi:hypothetical protein
MTTRARLAPSRNNIQEAFLLERNVRLRMMPGYIRVLKITSSALKYLDFHNNSGTLSHLCSLLHWAANTLLVEFQMASNSFLENPFSATALNLDPVVEGPIASLGYRQKSHLPF